MMTEQLDSAWFDATVDEDAAVVAALNYLSLNEHDASD